MKFLKELHTKELNEAEDLSELPYDVMNELENHIRNGAKDMDKQIENALELVKEAYRVENVELPNPALKKAWDQFSKLIEYATQNLLKYRGIDGDWRMSTYMFREAVEKQKTFAVTVKKGDFISQTKLYSPDKESLIKYLTDELTDEELSPVLSEEGNQMQLKLRRMGVNQDLTITLTEI